MDNIIEFPNKNPHDKKIAECLKNAEEIPDPVMQLEMDVCYLCMSLEQAMLRLKVVRKNLDALTKERYDDF